MRRTSETPRFLAFAALVASLAAGAGCADEPTPRSTSAPAAAYEVVPQWLKPPAGQTLGEAVGVGVDSHNHVFVFHRADRGWGNEEIIDKPTIWMVEGDSGEVLASWGENVFLVPHGLGVDKNDHVWVTDVGLDQIFEFSHDGALLQTIGRGHE
ncbi:hypothetical protein [Polyangium sp. y55x31]|uniref:hypothetical protein n=1 Tax=Polyangium sp. y55x31 TaxID=3042688 RepID=UPI0024831E70|nr:hypothetical protein [Polyangium sp. y55x31]MDI1479630.1 hypothetical protein [Polyangium sp. y55x31]